MMTSLPTPISSFQKSFFYYQRGFSKAVVTTYRNNFNSLPSAFFMLLSLSVTTNMTATTESILLLPALIIYFLASLSLILCAIEAINSALCFIQFIRDRWLYLISFPHYEAVSKSERYCPYPSFSRSSFGINRSAAELMQ